MICWALAETAEIFACNLPPKWAGDDRGILARRAGGRGQTAWAARALLRALLARTTGREDWQIRPDARGKPFAFLPDGSRGPFLSLSHSGAHVAVAVSEDSLLGVDIERHKQRDFVRLAAYAFGPREAVVAARSAADFYRLWTLREAMGKATGDGLRLAADGRDRICLLMADGAWSQEGWRLFSRVESEMSLAIAQCAYSNMPPWSAAALSHFSLPDLV